MADGNCTVCKVLHKISLKSEFYADDFVNICFESLLSISGTPNKKTCKHPPIIQWIKQINMDELWGTINPLTCGGCGCQEETTVTKTYCFKCRGFLCQGCEFVHMGPCMREHHEHTKNWKDITNLKVIYECLVSHKCSDCSDNDCIVLCTTCNYKAICQACVDVKHKHHNFQSVKLAEEKSKKKLSNILQKAEGNIQEINGLNRTIEEHIRERIQHLERRDPLIKELKAQREESKNNIKKKIKRLKDDLTIMSYLFDTLTSWTYWHFRNDMKRKVKDLLNRSRIGNFNCTEGQCETCAMINPAKVIRGPIGCVEILGSFNCKSQNVVYVITCKQCQLQYVGETSEGKKGERCLRDRMNEHRSVIRNNTGESCFYNHFKNGNCNDFTVAAVSHIEDKKIRKAVEAATMLKLGTVDTDKNKGLDKLPVSKLFKGLNTQFSLKTAQDQKLVKLNGNLFLGKTTKVNEETTTNEE